MKLSDYIQELQDILSEIGDTELLFTASDDEGNSYNRASFAPEVRLLHSKNPEKEWQVESLIEVRGDEPLQAWLDNNCLDEEDIPDLVRVVLL